MVPKVHRERLIAAAAKLGKLLTDEHLTIGKPGIKRRVIMRLR